MKEEEKRSELISFSSDEELYFAWYLEELEKNGFVEKWVYESKTYTLAEPIRYTYTERKISPKKKIVTEKVKEKILLEGASYTPDFEVYWTSKADNIFYGYSKGKDLKSFPFVVNEGRISVIEIKPIRERFNMKRLARQNLKWVYDKFKDYIQIVVPQTLFEATFTPERFLYTNKSMQKRSIRHEVNSLTHFINIYKS